MMRLALMGGDSACGAAQRGPHAGRNNDTGLLEGELLAKFSLSSAQKQMQNNILQLLRAGSSRAAPAPLEQVRPLSGSSGFSPAAPAPLSPLRLGLGSSAPSPGQPHPPSASSSSSRPPRKLRLLSGSLRSSWAAPAPLEQLCPLSTSSGSSSPALAPLNQLPLTSARPDPAASHVIVVHRVARSRRPPSFTAASFVNIARVVARCIACRVNDCRRRPEGSKCDHFMVERAVLCWKLREAPSVHMPMQMLVML